MNQSAALASASLPVASHTASHTAPGSSPHASVSAGVAVRAGRSSSMAPR